MNMFFVQDIITLVSITNDVITYDNIIKKIVNQSLCK
ncbi:MAG: hypothetical protein H6Q59_2869 [Firmicutes bacterium]|nr:hypothetical protein [Bacillota bacterium]